MTSIDRGDAHYDDAGGWAEACAHMGLFLAWCVRSRLASAHHVEQRAQLEAAPAAYVVHECDARLWAEDFAPGCEPLVRQLYDRYLPFYADRAAAATGSAYTLDLDDATREEIDRFLTAELRRLSPAHARLLASSQTPPQASAPAPARRVQHRKFGPGTVVAESRGGGELQLTIEFDEHGRKTILASFVTPLDG